MHEGDIDASCYSESHDVPCIWIGNQIVGVGDGYNSDMIPSKNKNHIRWKLKEGKKYRVVLEEVDEKEVMKNVE